MLWFTPLPPELYEVLNCALFAGATTVLTLCLRYLLTAYAQFRVNGLNRIEAFVALRTLRLSVAFSIFLLGEVPRMGYVWIVRYWGNTGRGVAWFSTDGWIFVPVVASTVTVFGFACIARAIVPESWGRFGYFGTLFVAAAAVIATQIFR